MYECPSGGCDFATPSLEGVAMHYVNKQDGDHRAYDKKWLVKQAVTDTGPSGSGSDSETDAKTDSETDPAPTGDPDLPDFPAGSTDSERDPNPAPDCCSDPELVGEPGEAYKLSDGRIIRLGEGARVCKNCEEVQEVNA